MTKRRLTLSGLWYALFLFAAFQSLISAWDNHLNLLDCLASRKKVCAMLEGMQAQMMSWWTQIYLAEWYVQYTTISLPV